jgi:hypothetical protein
MDTNNTTQSSGGIGFVGLLTILFIALKLTNVIAWSWLWVLSPIWIPFAAILAVFLAITAWHAPKIIAAAFRDWRRNRSAR